MSKCLTPDLSLLLKIQGEEESAVFLLQKLPDPPSLSNALALVYVYFRWWRTADYFWVMVISINLF